MATPPEGTTQSEKISESNVVYLSDLKFAGMKPAVPENRPQEKATAPQSVAQDPAQPQSCVAALSEGASCIPNILDKLASDKPGEELAPDSSIWRIYAKEAKEHDRDLVKRRNKNLDTMLLFAGLFSAILTAFLVESTDMLEPDLDQISANLLLSLAQSQWRIETGNQDKTLPVIEVPPFKPSSSARWINALWFMALALSLGAAMMAMIAKEWLEEFITPAPEHPHHYALKRQSRLEALLAWRTLQIVDLLPTLLHLSLVLFAVGLVSYLWLLDRAIAMIIAVASSSLAVAYLTLTAFGAFNEKCPYQTRVSKYIRRILRKNSKPEQRNDRGTDTTTEKPAEDEVTTAKELRALQWLMTKSRDPALGDSAFQSLAGLKSRTLKGCSGSTDEISQRAIEDCFTVVGMGLNILDRLSDALTKYPRELAFYRGANAARYAGALPEIYQSACKYLRWHNSNDQSIRNSDNNPAINKAARFKERVFKALDKIWDGDCPPFTAEAYAELTAAELRLTGSALENMTEQTFRNVGSSAPDLKLGSSPSHASIAVIPHLPSNNAITEAEGKTDWPAQQATLRNGSRPSVDDPQRFKLQARCSRALCRAAFQLAFHLNGRAPIGNFSLINLLEAISGLVKDRNLESQGYLITHHPQEEQNTSAPSIVTLVSGANGYRVLNSADIGDEDGLLVGLTSLLGSDSAKGLSKVEIAAADAMGEIGPRLIKQWVRIQRESHKGREGPPLEDTYDENPLPEWSYASGGEPKNSELIGTVYMPRTTRIITYLFEVSHFAISFPNHPGIRQLPDIALKSLYNRASTPPLAQCVAYKVISPQHMRLKTWITAVGRVGAQGSRRKLWSQEAKTYLLRLLAIRGQQGGSIFWKLLASIKDDGDAKEVLLTILETMANGSGKINETETLLDDISSGICDEAMNGKYSECFTHASDGFDILRRVGSHANHAKHVSGTIKNLIIHLTKSDRELIKLDAVPGFLEAALFVCQSPPPDRGAPFLPSVASTLKRLLGDILSVNDDSFFVWSRQKVLDKLIAASGSTSDQETKLSFIHSRDAIKKEEERRRKGSPKPDPTLTAVPPALSGGREGGDHGGDLGGEGLNEGHSTASDPPRTYIPMM